MYRYLEHEADIGIEATGRTLEEAFAEGAKAMFSIMVELDTIKPSSEVRVECEAPGIPELFVEWLNTLLAHKDIDDMLFSDFSVKITGSGPYRLEGTARGEEPGPHHRFGTEVKAATYYGLKYEHNGLHKLTCVLDI